MKRILIIASAVIAVLAIGLLFWKRERTPTANLSDGTKVLLLETFVGPHRAPQSDGQPWTKWLRRLPPNLRRFFPRLAISGNTPGRTWHHVPADTNSLHVWLERWDAVNPQSSELDEYPIVITDRDGWVWFNHGLSHIRPAGTSRVDYVGYNLAGFPRWEEFLDLRLFHSQWIGGRRALDTLGTLRIRNPAYTAAPTQWTVRPLPQSMTFDGVEATLSGLEFRRNWQGTPDDTSTQTPRVNLKLSVDEPQNGDRISGVWHEVNKSFFDNYGNNSHDGLPPRRVRDTNAPPIQWRIVVELVGDHRSQVASNSFLEVPRKSIPGIGERAPIENTTLELSGGKIWLASLLGPGHATYENGILKTNFVPTPEITGYGSSVGFREQFGGRAYTVGIGSGFPHLAFGYEGELESLRFSVRAVDETGQTLWLTQDGKASSQPSFHREYNRRQLLWFSCEGLDPARNWQFILGVHRPRQVEFLIQRAEWDGKWR